MAKCKKIGRVRAVAEKLFKQLDCSSMLVVPDKGKLIVAISRPQCVEMRTAKSVFCAINKNGRPFAFHQRFNCASEDFYPEFDEIVLSGYVDHFKRDEKKIVIYCKRCQYNRDTFEIMVLADTCTYFKSADPAAGDFLKVRATFAFWAGDTIWYSVSSDGDILEHSRITIFKGNGDYD